MSRVSFPTCVTSVYQQTTDPFRGIFEIHRGIRELLTLREFATIAHPDGWALNLHVAAKTRTSRTHLGAVGVHVAQSGRCGPLRAGLAADWAQAAENVNGHSDEVNPTRRSSSLPNGCFLRRPSQSPACS